MYDDTIFSSFLGYLGPFSSFLGYLGPSPNSMPIREVNLFLNSNASDFISVQWASDTHNYRVFTKFTRILRHPWMPLDGSGMKVYDSTAAKAASRDTFSSPISSLGSLT